MDSLVITFRRWLHAAAVAVVLAALLTACRSGGETADTDPSGELSIVATTTILADVTSQVAGDAARVTTLMEPGSDPHNFEASAQQLAALHEADLIVANGANLEENLLGPLGEAERAGVPVFHATDHIETLTFAGGHATEDEHAGEDHDADSVDPHFWMDPMRMADVAHALGERIGELAEDPDAITARADDYAARLEAVDGDIRQMLSTVPDEARTLVTNHESFNYFADRYDFAIVGTVIPGLSTGAEPSAQDLEALAQTVEQQQVRAVFTENTAPDQLTQALAAEVGTDIEVIELHSDSLDQQGSAAATYIDMLTVNAELVSEALRR